MLVFTHMHIHCALCYSRRIQIQIQNRIPKNVSSVMQVRADLDKKVSPFTGHMDLQLSNGLKEEILIIAGLEFKLIKKNQLADLIKELPVLCLVNI